MGPFSAQTLLTIAAYTVVVFSLGVLVGLFMQPDRALRFDKPDGARGFVPPRQSPPSQPPQLFAVGSRRVRAGPLREAVDDACDCPRTH